MFLEIFSTSSTALRRLAARGIDPGANLSPPSQGPQLNHALGLDHKGRNSITPWGCQRVCPLRGSPAPDWITDSDDCNRGQVSIIHLDPSLRRWNPSRPLPLPSAPTTTPTRSPTKT